MRQQHNGECTGLRTLVCGSSNLLWRTIDRYSNFSIMKILSVQIRFYQPLVSSLIGEAFQLFICLVINAGVVESGLWHPPRKRKATNNRPWVQILPPAPYRKLYSEIPLRAGATRKNKDPRMFSGIRKTGIEQKGLGSVPHIALEETRRTRHGNLRKTLG